MEEDFPQILPDHQHLEQSEPQRQCEILVPRSKILKNMIEEFNDSSILHDIVTFVLIGDNGCLEIDRGAGVRREILSLFWRELSVSLAIGAAEKVPSIRHDYQKNQWLSTARIMKFGYEQVNYFPIFLSKAFVIGTIFWRASCDKRMSTNHHELVQKPKYISTAWGDELQALKFFPEFFDVSSLYMMYEGKKPTSKRVV